MRAERPARRWFTSGSRLALEEPVRIDFQMHTCWSDGRSSVREMIEAADGIELSAIAITEHVNEDSAWYPDFVAEVKAERLRGHRAALYFGAEIAAADYSGRLKADPSRLETELVVGVVHRLPKEIGSGFWSFEELTRDDAIELEVRALLELATNRQVDVIGHPGGTAFKKFGAFPIQWLEPVFQAAREHEVAIELNSKYLWDFEGTLELLRRVDPLVSFGSDAHQAGDVGSQLSCFEPRRQKGAPVLAS